MEVAIRGRWSARGDTLRGAERARECQELKGERRSRTRMDTEHRTHTHTNARRQDKFIRRDTLKKKKNTCNSTITAKGVNR